jgi:hypothetical protein
MASTIVVAADVTIDEQKSLSLLGVGRCCISSRGGSTREASLIPIAATDSCAANGRWNYHIAGQNEDS